MLCNDADGDGAVLALPYGQLYDTMTRIMWVEGRAIRRDHCDDCAGRCDGHAMSRDEFLQMANMIEECLTRVGRV